MLKTQPLAHGYQSYKVVRRAVGCFLVQYLSVGQVWSTVGYQWVGQVLSTVESHIMGGCFSLYDTRGWGGVFPPTDEPGWGRSLSSIGILWMGMGVYTSQ